MAHLPHTISQLCALVHLPPESLCLVCAFCDKLMQSIDYYHFGLASLSLIWRRGWPFACCLPCCLTASFLEVAYFYEGSASAETVESLTCNTLSSLPVRCHCCLKYLTEEEKNYHREQKVFLHRIRGRWKGCCTYCRDAWAEADFE